MQGDLKEKGGQLGRKRDEASSSIGHVNKTRGTQVSWMARNRFKYLYSEEEKKALT
jgi:hypothetical protein